MIGYIINNMKIYWNIMEHICLSIGVYTIQCIWDYINSLREIRSWPPSTMELQRVLNTAHKQLAFGFQPCLGWLKLWDGLKQPERLHRPIIWIFRRFYYWLVVSNIFFHNIGDNPSHWLSYFFKMVKTTNQTSSPCFSQRCIFSRTD